MKAVKNRNKKRNQEGCVCQDNSSKLTPAQAEIYTYLDIQALTVSQIASRRGCSPQYIRKVRKQLRDLGLMSKVAPPLSRKGVDSATIATKNRRLHAQKFRIELIKPISENYYKKHIGHVLPIDGNNVQCFEKVICVQAKEKSFYGIDEDDALSKSLEYWNRFFIKLENYFDVVIIKPRRENITMTYAEWATEGCELSEECEKRAERIRIFSKEDGKLRYTTDWSNLYEREAHHHRTGKEDSETGNRFIEDVLDHPESPTYTQLVKVVHLVANQTSEVSAGLNAIVKSQIPKKEESVSEKFERPDYIG